MKPKAFRIAFPRKSRLGTFLSLAITLSLLTPLVPATFSAGGGGSPLVGNPLAVASAAAVAPMITATKSDAFPSHPSGKAEKGDTITYTVQIANSGTDAANVNFSDTVDANTTLVPGSVTTTPVAIDDTYSAVGNVRINVPAPGVTANDSDPDGGTITAVAGSTTSANGGEVTVNADGSFTYNPPAGFEGADTFTYTINGAGAPSNTATVTVNVAGLIWFVNAAAVGGDGRLTSPFSALSDLVASGMDDNIFLYSGNYAGGLTLQSGQKLIGEGATDSLAVITGLTPPSYSDPLPATGGAKPVIGGASGISIATPSLSNLIRGIAVANTGGTAISGTDFIALSVEETTVSNTNGAGVTANATGANSVTLTISNSCIFEGISGSAIVANSSDTSTMNATVKDSTFQNAPIDGKNNIIGNVLQGGHGTFSVLNNTFNNVFRTASTGESLINLNGNAALAGNSFSANVSGNTISNVGGGTTACGGGAVYCAGPLQAIGISIGNATNVSGTILVDGNNLTAVQQGGLLLDMLNTGVGLSPISAKIINNVFGTNASRVGMGTTIANGFGMRVQRRTDGSPSANVLISGNTVRNGNGAAGSALNGPGIHLRTQNTSSMDVTATGNNIDTSFTAANEMRVETSQAGSVHCLDASGNTFPAGASAIIELRETAGALNVEQSSASDLSTSNGGVTVTAGAGTPNYGVACAAPVASLRRPNTNGQYLAAVPAMEGARNHSYLTDVSSNVVTFDMMSGINAWRMNSKSLGGVSFNYAARNVSLGSGLTDPSVRLAHAATPAFSGETVNLNIGTLPAGKSMTITFQVTINNTINVPQVSNQGTVSYTGGSVLTDDPDTGAFGDPTVTPVFLGVPPDISCPADISVNTDPGVSTASVSFSVTATGTPTPTVDCKIGATSITSPHTFPLGETTVMCTATNGVAPDDSCSFKVKVLYNFTGFFSPVSNPPVFNEVKAGQGIPVKFSLSGNKGLNIFFPGYPMSQQINCADNVPINALEGTETSGGSSLSYNAGSDTYTYNWKTEKSWAGTCRMLVVKLADGTEHVAYFKFK